MDKMLKKEFGLSRKAKIGIAAGALFFLVMSALIYGKLYIGIKEVVINQAIGSLTNISQLNADTVSRSFISRQNLLETFSINLSAKKTRDYPLILKEMKAYADIYDFYDMGILTNEGILHQTTGRAVDVTGIPQYETALNSGTHISESFLPVGEKEYRVNLISVPVYYEGEKAFVITASCLSKGVTERMNISFLKNKGYNFLVNTEGELAVYPKHYNDKTYSSLMKYINDTPEIIPGQSGNIWFLYNGEKYFAHFEEIGVNDWSLMTCAREKDVFADANVIMTGVFIGISALWVQIFISTSVILFLVVRARRRTQSVAFYDELLGIGNGQFLKTVYGKIPQEQRSRMSLMVFDIDKFKEFNYIYGEDAGDGLLKYIVKTIREELPEDYLFRFLADNFAILMKSHDEEEIGGKIARILGRFNSDIEGGAVQPFDISAGVRQIHEGEGYQRVVSDALLAKGTVKGIQVQQYAFYDENLRARRMNYMEMESDFSKALRNGEFQAYYQPKYDMATGRIVGAEALSRWVKPDGRVISPEVYIPCFEASRQVIHLDESMLESVCAHMKEMEAEGIAVENVSVNLSRVHLRHHGILPKIAHIIEQSGINPSMITFEITESALYEDSIPLKEIVEFLHKLGSRVSMDDYGKGVSGPNSLVTNRFDEIKLDKSFIDSIGDGKMESVIRSTIHLSQELGMNIVAEGVEERHQADALVEWGCRTAQGYLYSPPVPAGEYRRLLKESMALGAAEA